MRSKNGRVQNWLCSGSSRDTSPRLPSPRTPDPLVGALAPRSIPPALPHHRGVRGLLAVPGRQRGRAGVPGHGGTGGPSRSPGTLRPATAASYRRAAAAGSRVSENPAPVRGGASRHIALRPRSWKQNPGCGNKRVHEAPLRLPRHPAAPPGEVGARRARNTPAGKAPHEGPPRPSSLVTRFSLCGE